MINGQFVVGQIGCGAFAAAMDLPNFHKHPAVVCKWCCDVSGESASTLAARFGVPNVTTDFHEILADPDVDFLKIATSHEAHLPIIEAAAAVGKHVFCEKPLALDETEALKIIRAVQRSGIKLCVDYNRRMAPTLRVLRQRWQEHLQNPQHNAWRYVEAPRALFPEENQTQFLMRIQDESISYRTVHLDPLRGGGQIIGESVHWLDLACWMFAPQAPIEIQAWGSRRFSHGIHLTFSSGDVATIIFNCGGTFDYPKELYEITSNGALFRCEHFVENEYFGMPGPTREIFPLRRDSFPDVGAQGGFDGYREKYAARVRSVQNSKHAAGELEVDKGHYAMLDGFVRAIREGTPTPCDEMAGFISTYLAQQAIRSIELRQSLPIPIDKVHFSVL